MKRFSKLNVLELLEEHGCSMTSLGRGGAKSSSGKLREAAIIMKKSKEELEIIHLNKNWLIKSWLLLIRKSKPNFLAYTLHGRVSDSVYFYFL